MSRGGFGGGFAGFTPGGTFSKATQNVSGSLGSSGVPKKEAPASDDAVSTQSLIVEQRDVEIRKPDDRIFPEGLTGFNTVPKSKQDAKPDANDGYRQLRDGVDHSGSHAGEVHGKSGKSIPSSDGGEERVSCTEQPRACACRGLSREAVIQQTVSLFFRWQEPEVRRLVEDLHDRLETELGPELVFGFLQSEAFQASFRAFISGGAHVAENDDGSEEFDLGEVGTKPPVKMKSGPRRDDRRAEPSDISLSEAGGVSENRRGKGLSSRDGMSTGDVRPRRSGGNAKPRRNSYIREAFFKI